MITLLTGENDFSMRQRANELEDKFKSVEPDGDITRIEASDLEADELKGLLTNASLFSQKSLVILKNIDDNKAVAEHLPGMLEGLVEDTDLILVSPKPDKRTRWYKAVSKKGKIEKHDEMNENQLSRWTVERAKELGAKISLSGARLLVSRVGLNQTRLDNELKKLAVYDPVITKDGIELLVEKTLEESIFNLIDTVVKGRAKKAHSMYDDLLLIDIDAYKFIGLLSWQLHNLLLIKANENTPPGRLASQTGLAPFVVNKTKRMSANLTLKQIKQMITATLQADLDIKQTRADNDSRIKLLIDQIGVLAAGRAY